MRQRIKITGLVLLATLGISAIATAVAQASGELRVEGKVLAEKEQAEVEGVVAKTKTLVPGLGITLECESAKVTGVTENLTIGGIKHAHGGGKVLAHGCKIAGNKFCTIYPTVADRTAKTNAGLITGGGLVLEKLLSSPTRHYLVTTPLAGGIFTTTYYTIGGGCTLPSENEISGSAALRIPNATTEQTEHTLEPITVTEETELGVSLSYGKEKMAMDGGTGSGHLIGKFLNRQWSMN